MVRGPRRQVFGAVFHGLKCQEAQRFIVMGALVWRQVDHGLAKSGGP